MICKNCGKENPENYTFCQNCGKRLDGKKVCPSCGGLIEEEAIFCGLCGTRVDGQPQQPENKPQAETAVAAKKSGTALGKIFELLGLIFVGIAALAGFAFTFCIGVSASGAQANIYSYFGEAYEDLSLESLNEAQKAIALIPNIFGTVISALALVCGVVFAILTVVSAVNKFAKNKQNAKYAEFATATYISFALAATLFLAIHATSSRTSSVSASAGFNSATLAGLIIGGIFLGAYYCCRIVSNISAYKNSKVLTQSIVSATVGVLAVAALGVLPLPVIEITQSGLKTSLGYFTGSILMVDAVNPEASQTIICEILGYCSQIVVAVMTALIIVKSAGSFGEEKPKNTLVFAIVGVVFAVADLVAAELSVQALVSYLGQSAEGAKIGYAIPIVLLVFEFLALAGVVTNCVLSAKKPPENNAEIQ